MANPKGNLESLRPYESKWRSGKTQTIRVPIALAEQILVLARQLDVRESLVTEDDETTRGLPEAADLLNKLKAKHKKSRANLTDVEAILELLGSANSASKLTSP